MIIKTKQKPKNEQKQNTASEIEKKRGERTQKKDKKKTKSNYCPVKFMIKTVWIVWRRKTKKTSDSNTC